MLTRLWQTCAKHHALRLLLAGAKFLLGNAQPVAVPCQLLADYKSFLCTCE
jgi:hypothetical protein